MFDDTGKVFVRDLGLLGTQLLAEPFSELTRKRQYACLAVSVATIAVSLGLVTVGGIENDFIKSTVTDASLLKPVAGAICCYLALLYVIAVFADMQARWYGQIAARLDALNRTNSNLTSQLTNRKQLNDLWPEVWALRDSRTEFCDEYTTLRERNRAEIEPIHSEIRRLLDATQPLEMSRANEIGKLSREIDALREKEAKIRSRQEPEEKAYWAIIEKMDDYDKGKEIGNRLKAIQAEDRRLLAEARLLRQVISRSQIVHTSRIALEIIFPLALSILAIGQAFRT